MHLRTRLFMFFFLLGTLPILAQPSNDECVQAVPLTELSSWCSAVAAFSTTGATESAEASPFCFPNNQTNNDVWFSFVAQATDLNVGIIGNTNINAGGTLNDPQVAIYQGPCSNLNEIECISDNSGVDAIQTFAFNLMVGETYYLRVGARNGNTGTFQLCINNFNQVPEPSSDCNTGVILCDKSPFTVEFITGAGSNPNEIDDVGCNTSTCIISESSSSWYKWTCKDAGTLSFILNPLNPVDDIDFVVYELPNGIDDCSGKFDLRCMASGENVGSPFVEWQPCTGATGLSLTDTDQNEVCGCQAGDNNFAAAIDMEVGKSYALVINNFSNSGSGFSVEFGGTGTFLGPEAAYTTSEPDQVLCVGQSITFNDASSFIGDLVGWTWNFGPGASPATASGDGPHTVSYNRPGIKSIVLAVESDGGCIVTEIGTILVECCSDHFSIDADIATLLCPNDETGAIDLMADSDFAPFDFEWSTGSGNEDITALGLGDYTVTIADASTCDTVVTFTVDGPPPIVLNPTITMPTCDGGTDGAISLQVTGGTPSYQYNWENTGFGSDNTFNNIAQGDYTVIIRDQNGCEVMETIEVRELELMLDPTVQAIIPPSCTGFSDGSIELNISNGLGPYQYNFNDGNGYVNENSLSALPMGTYVVDVLDANLCQGSFVFNMEDPPPLSLDFDPTNISCNGEADGSITAIVGGGVGNYSYSWSNNQTTETLNPLPPGTYSLTVLDGNNCEIIGETTLIEPDPVFIDLGEIENVICNGESTGAISVIGSGGTPPFEYSIDGATFQMEDIFTGLAAGTYTLSVMDAMGCSVSLQAVVTEPPPLLVYAGEDQTIDLGFSARLRAVPNSFPVDFQWSPEENILCSDCPATEVSPFNTTTYLITITNEDGCQATDEVTIFVVKNRPIYVPNAFSPNNDGINDFFTIYTGPAASRINTIKIFSRWGSLVFEAFDIPPNDPSFGWDGTFKDQLVNPGVFAFFAEVGFIDGEVVLVEGDITVVR